MPVTKASFSRIDLRLPMTSCSHYVLRETTRSLRGLALREKFTLVMGIDRSSVTKEPRKVTGRYPLLMRHIRNRHKTTIVTITSHRSREMAVSLGPQGTFVTGTKYSPL
jgi:hypothetical protein